METKRYLKPDAEYILFYSDEELLSLSLEEGAESEGGDGTVGGDTFSGSEGSKPIDPEDQWEVD